MMEKIVKLLKERTALKGWKIEEKTTYSYQLFLIKREVDMNRALETKEYMVTIYKECVVKQEKLQGEYSFCISPDMSEEQIMAKLDEAEALSVLSLNKPYELTKKQNERSNEKEASFGGKTLKEACFIIADSILEVDTYAKGYVNSAEIFVNFEKKHFLNSLENEFTYAKTYAQMDIVVSWKEEENNLNGEEIELHRFFEFDSLKHSYISGVVNDLLQEAEDRAKALKKYPDEKNVKVMLKNENLKEIFNYFVEKTCVDNIFDKMSNTKIGDRFYEVENNEPINDCDRLTITLDGLLSGSSKNALYDDDGVALRTLKIIDNGQVKTLWGSSQKSQYLRYPINGKFQNVIVETGTLEAEDLQGFPYLEIVCLSDMNVDLLTGDFGSEIRFAYYHTKKGEIIPVTGGSIVGNVLKSMKTIKFSKEECNLNNYKMPKYAMLEQVCILKK